MERDIFLSEKSIALILLERADAQTMQKWVNDYRITRFLGRNAMPMYREQESEWIDGLPEKSDHLVLGIWHIRDRKLIGSIGLHQIDHLNQNAELGIMIGDHQYWSKHLGRRAIALMCRHGFTRLNLRRIFLRVLDNNPRGKSCYNQLGFTVVGTFPRHVFKDGEWRDETFMLLDRESFLRK